MTNKTNYTSGCVINSAHAKAVLLTCFDPRLFGPTEEFMDQGLGIDSFYRFSGPAGILPATESRAHDDWEKLVFTIKALSQNNLRSRPEIVVILHHDPCAWIKGTSFPGNREVWCQTVREDIERLISRNFSGLDYQLQIYWAEIDHTNHVNFKLQYARIPIVEVGEASEKNAEDEEIS
ncbi:MAG: hypothetical protein M1150_02390 [Patescibacteria group bacterium]|nr:hypothetical protein [Patescibacteria group bacterium]